MPLPPVIEGLTIKPIPQFVISDQSALARSLSANLWLEVSAASILLPTDYANLFALMGKWDATNWLSTVGIPTGYRYRLKRINSVQPFDKTNVLTSYDADMQMTSLAPALTSNAMPITCPEFDGFQCSPLPTHAVQTFDSGRSRVIGRALGRRDQFSITFKITTAQFLSFLTWYASLQRSGMPSVSAPWLSDFTPNLFFKFLKPWSATFNNKKFELKIEGISCAN